MAASNVQSYSVPVAAYDATAQNGNISATTIYAIPAGKAGMYRAHLYIRQTATGTASVTPTVDIIFTGDSLAAVTTGTTSGAPGHLIATNNTNATTVCNQVTFTFYADASTNIQFVTAGGTYAGMTYNLRVRLEYLG
jgi:hypothetical protein